MRQYHITGFSVLTVQQRPSFSILLYGYRSVSAVNCFLSHSELGGSFVKLHMSSFGWFPPFIVSFSRIKSIQTGTVNKMLLSLIYDTENSEKSVCEKSALLCSSSVTEVVCFSHM